MQSHSICKYKRSLYNDASTEQQNVLLNVFVTSCRINSFVSFHSSSIQTSVSDWSVKMHEMTKCKYPGLCAGMCVMQCCVCCWILRTVRYEAICSSPWPICVLYGVIVSALAQGLNTQTLADCISLCGSSWHNHVHHVHSSLTTWPYILCKGL